MQVFDETEGNWAMHLSGAQHLLRRLSLIRDGNSSSEFLYTWFLYHEVLGEFIDPLKYYPDGPASLQLKSHLHFDTSLVSHL